jgi:hypothetical protein
MAIDTVAHTSIVFFDARYLISRRHQTQPLSICLPETIAMQTEEVRHRQKRLAVRARFGCRILPIY